MRRTLGRALGALLALFCLPALVLLPLRWVDPPTTSYMLQSPTQPLRHAWVEPSRLGPWLPLAAVASEDQKFPRHPGFDLEAIEEALADGAGRGASTISQQTAKNLFLWPGGWLRKGIEAWITLWLEWLWPKGRILQVYLNIAEFGPGIYGAQAAARAHFGRDAASLSRHQAARLVAVLPAPRSWPVHGSYADERARWIEGQMRQLGRGYIADIWPP